MPAVIVFLIFDCEVAKNGVNLRIITLLFPFCFATDALERFEI
jgi:hypothetical protein